MRCPLCGDDRSAVLETYRKGEKIRRRRECAKYRFRWTTVEAVLDRLLPARLRPRGKTASPTLPSPRQ